MSAPPGEEQAGTVAPACYRHPDRRTRIRCTRCDRPICTECMKPASVGFQCPDDVAEAARAQRAPRTRFGGRASTDDVRTTGVLVAVLALVQLVQLAVPETTTRFGLSAAAIAVEGTWERLVTAGFLHGGLMHLLFNGLALMLVGPILEQQLGRARLLAVLGVSLLGGSVGSLLLNSPATLSVGASGAVFGAFGALLVLQRRTGADTGGLVALLGINLVLSVVVPRIDLWAHLGGLVAGAAVGAAFALAPRRLRGAVGVAAPAVLLCVLVGVAVVRVLSLREAAGLG